MPEYPDVEVYVEAIRRRAGGGVLEDLRLGSPFVLRTVTPPVEAIRGRRLENVERVGKRIVLALEGGLYVVVHLMIAGRLRWKERRAAMPRRLGLAAFDFECGTVLLTEAGSKKRASIRIVEGPRGVAALDPGGLEIIPATPEAFADRLLQENRTLKRALTDPRVFSGIGNAYSDEILHRARLSPLARTRSLDEVAVERLRQACVDVLEEWRRRLLRECGDGFPEKVTAFRPEMAVHGRYGKPCPVCGDPVQRVRYADHEMNYCATCQTDGRLLADRGLSRLLGKDWPRTLADLESLGRPDRPAGPDSG